MVYSEAERKERANIAKKKYYHNNIEKIAEQRKLYYLENKEKLDEKQKKYYLDNPKSYIIQNWKSQGIIDDDYDLLYDVFIKETNCWICGKDFNKDIVMDIRCLDHDHDITDDGNVRYILCGYCNLHVVVR